MNNLPPALSPQSSSEMMKTTQTSNKSVAFILDNQTIKPGQEEKDHFQLQDKIIQILKRNLIQEIFPCLVAIDVKRDEEFAEKLSKAIISEVDFRVESAILSKMKPSQDEVAEMHKLKDPDDKFKCLNRAYNFIKLFGGFSSHQDLSMIGIMAYIIFSVKPPNLISNIKFLRLFGTDHYNTLKPYVFASKRLFMIIDSKNKSIMQHHNRE